MEFARQYVRDNNGRLLASIAYLSKRGWSSRDVITRAKRELIAAGFIHETVMGHRPNKAGWYAVTWRILDKIPGYDFGAAETFERGAYRKGAPVIRAVSASSGVFDKNVSLRPSHGHIGGTIGPSHGLEGEPLGPSHGAIDPCFGTSPRPSHGHHLENHLVHVGLEVPASNEPCTSPHKKRTVKFRRQMDLMV